MSKVLMSVDEEGVATVTLDDPPSLNAAGLDLMEELSTAFETAASDPAARCVVLTGQGRGFCSGANLAGGVAAASAEGPVDAGAGLERVYNPFMRRLRSFPKPLVAAVNGPAAGIGVSFALACDLVVAAESAYFLQAFRRIGLVPDGGATWLLPRLVGKARAMELMLLGDRLPARTALEWGLINRCVADDELLPTAHDLARQLATGPASLSEIRALVWGSMEASFEDQLEAERQAQGRMGRTGDFREGVAAFLSKRPARFTGA